MTEAEWLATDDIGRMLAFVTGGYHDGSPGTDEARRRGSPRRLRLFACAVCRQAWAGVPCGRCDDGRVYAGQSAYPCKYCNGTGKVGGLTDPRSRLAVETVERHADGLATDDELAAACQYAGEVAGPSDDASWWAYVWAAGGHVGQASGRIECVPAAVQAALLRDVVGNPFRPTPRCQSCLGGGYVPTDRDDNTCDVCGGKGRHVPRRWLTPTVRALARACYDERGGEACGRCVGSGVVGKQLSRLVRDVDSPCPDCGGTGRVATTGHLDPVRLAILADELDSAGCTDAALLAHLRGWETVPAVDGGVTKALVTVPLRGPHVRGCFAVDAVLGLS